MDSLSKAFLHYKKGTGIEINSSLKSLRKIYIACFYQVMQTETRLLTSHSTTIVLESYYIDPKILSLAEKAAMETKIFGMDSSL
jgi:hypothetical protein